MVQKVRWVLEVLRVLLGLKVRRVHVVQPEKRAQRVLVVPLVPRV